jgi:hypothetical protein
LGNYSTSFSLPNSSNSEWAKEYIGKTSVMRVAINELGKRGIEGVYLNLGG